MFLVPWLESFQWVTDHAPYKLLKKRRLNFITIHYLYILSMTIIASILLYPAGGLEYIDALFFASGCATQSGLNTRNLNDMNTYQQVILYMVPMLCTPIFIHSFVVFVRLYWFEKRFQNIVKDPRNFRTSRSRTKTEAKDDLDPSAVEKGVRGRRIVVLHNRPPRSLGQGLETQKSSEGQDSHTSSESSQIQKAQDSPAPFHRDIVFADELQARESEESDTPVVPQLSPEQHIAIRENQRNPRDKSALRIPGPRDFDRGREPEPFDAETEAPEVTHQATASNEPTASADGHLERRNIIIDKSNHAPRLRVDTSTFPKLSKRKSDLRDMVNAPTEEIPPHSARLKNRTGTFSSLREWASKEHETVAPYLSWQPTIGRNSAFVDLTEEQREELGGIEYRSLKTLALVLVLYYCLFHLLGVVVLLPWILRTPQWGSVVLTNSMNRAWWGIFTPASLFNDLGYTLTPDSFQSFQLAVLPLLLGSYLIIIGNTGFPCMLRLVIWIASKIAREGSGIWEEFMFLLDHPRRCFTLLFPSTATWWLFWILVALNGLDIIFFIVLDLNDEAINSINPVGFRVLNGLFQAASTRTAGFASVNLANLHPGIQVSYMIMMYISVFPTAISMRRTNVYEEKSLGIYSSPSEELDDEKEPSYVGAHLRKQLSFDLWYIFLGLFIIAIAEGNRLQNTNEYAFTLYSVLFEIVSAYGTVGLSLGYPNVDTSFSGQFTVVSKLVIIAMQIRGRHRGLPYELDRAILLPSEKVHKTEDVDAGRRVHRRNSNLGDGTFGGHALTSRASTLSRTPASALPHVRYADTGKSSGLQSSDVKDDANIKPASPRSGPVRRGLGNLMADMAEGPKIGDT